MAATRTAGTIASRAPRLALATLLTALVGVLASPAEVSAQLNGVPVWAAGIPNTMAPNAALLQFSTTTGEDFLGTNNKAEWGFTGSYRRAIDAGFTWLTATGGIGATERDVAPGDREWLAQGYISLGGRIVPFSGEDVEGAISVSSGFGYSALPGSSDEQNFLIGIDGTIGLNPGGWILDIWLMPRWSWRWTNLGSGSATQNGFGLSAGLQGGFIWGLVIQLAADKVWLGAAQSTTLGLPATEPWAFSAGLGLNF